MNRRDKLADLARLAALVEDAERARLARAAAERNSMQAAITALGESPALPSAPDIAASLNAEQHELWRVQRRATLNLGLARATARYLEAKGDAAKAFGRASVLARLAEKGRKG